MQNNNYEIKDIIKSAFKEKSKTIKKRLIYDNALYGGLSSKWIMLALILLPFAMYASIFNPISFNALGIAQAIVFYIILLVIAMQIVIVVAYFNNKKVVKNCKVAWKYYFPTIDFKMLLSAGVTPYVDFKKHYELALKDDLDNDALASRLTQAFSQMEEENSMLVEAIKRDQVKKDQTKKEEM